MRVDIKLSENITEPYAVIYTNEINEEINKIANSFKEQGNVISVIDGEKIIVLQKSEIYMVRTENSQVVVYCKDKVYKSKKRLYELGGQLGAGFMQISKFAFVNLKMLDSVEPHFNGVMNLKLKNGCSEYISRKYLPEFKKYLGI